MNNFSQFTQFFNGASSNTQLPTPGAPMTLPWHTQTVHASAPKPSQPPPGGHRAVGAHHCSSCCCLEAHSISSLQTTQLNSRTRSLCCSRATSGAWPACPPSRRPADQPARVLFHRHPRPRLSLRGRGGAVAPRRAAAPARREAAAGGGGAAGSAAGGAAAAAALCRAVALAGVPANGGWPGLLLRRPCCRHS